MMASAKSSTKIPTAVMTAATKIVSTAVVSTPVSTRMLVMMKYSS
ncbi:MAG TPA: hypothetical protein VF458_03840 [Ktedonobacteraceae bacterium]